MTPKQKALIAALLDKAAAERKARNTKSVGVTQGASDGVTQQAAVSLGKTGLAPNGDAPAKEPDAVSSDPAVGSAVAPANTSGAADGRKGSRHRLGQAAYMREYRARKKAEGGR